MRILLNYGNITFKDERITFEEWPQLKPNTPFGQVPVLVWDGEEIAQSMAIARFIAKKVGLVGKTDLEFALADSVPCHYEDVSPKHRRRKRPWPRNISQSSFLNGSNPWRTCSRSEEIFAGTGVTFADLAVMVVLDFLQEPDCAGFKDMNNLEERKKVLDAFPLVKANYQRTCALPQVVAYKKQRPAFNTGFMAV